MNKLGAILLAGVVTVGIGAGAVFGAEALASNPNPEIPADNAGIRMSDTAQGINADTAKIIFTGYSEVTPLDEAAPAADSEEDIPVRRSATSVSAEDIENGATITVNGKEVLLKDYIYGQEPGADVISKETAIDSAIKALMQKYTLTQEQIDKFDITTKYYTEYEGMPGSIWRVNLDPINTDDFAEIGSYMAILDAGTGEALRLTSAAEGQG